MDRQPILADSDQISEILVASPILPKSILPLPVEQTNNGADKEPSPHQAYARPLGCAALQVVQQRLEGYRLGELAHVENLMPGELRKRDLSHRLSWREDLGNNETSSYNASSDDRRRSQSELAELPSLELKRAFNQLKQQYGNDGLSVTVTGNWTDTVGNGTPQSVDRTVQQLLRHAAEYASHEVNVQRQRTVLEEHSSKDNRRFDNSAGATRQVGIYRWIDALYHMKTIARGQRLILEIILPTPGDAYLHRLQTLHGLNPTPPSSPWLTIEGPAGVTRENYTELATRYHIAEPPAPPQEQLILNVSLQLRPPQTTTKLTIPDGYKAQSAKLAWAFTPSASSNEQSPALNVLVGSQNEKLDTSSPSGNITISPLDPVDGELLVAIVGQCEDFNLNIVVTCAFDDASTAFQAWQSRIFNVLSDAYRDLNKKFRGQLRELAAMDNPITETRHQLCRQAINCLIQAHTDNKQNKDKSQGWEQDALALQLELLFEHALDWDEMIYTFYNDYHGPDDPQRWDWLQTRQKCGNAGGLNELLRAGTARLLVPVRVDYPLIILHYLTSGGRLWPGSERRVAVHEDQLALAATIKSCGQKPPSAPEFFWNMTLPTSWMILQDSDRLPIMDNPIWEKRP